MTKEDQDSEVGRIVRERRDLRAHHEALISRADTTSKLLSSLGKALNLRSQSNSMTPVTLSLDEDGAVSVSDEYHPQQILRGHFPTVNDLRELIAETKDVKKRLADLDTHLKAFGV
jgi:hypothetical protein